MIRIHDRVAQTVPYEQVLRERKRKVKKNSGEWIYSFCPGEIDAFGKMGVRRIVLEALGNPVQPNADHTPPFLADEAATQPVRSSMRVNGPADLGWTRSRLYQRGSEVLRRVLFDELRVSRDAHPVHEKLPRELHPIYLRVSIEGLCGHWRYSTTDGRVI